MQLTVKEWRKAKGISIEKMAQIIGIHHVTYAKRECEPSKFTVEQANAIASALNVPMEYIIFLP